MTGRVADAMDEVRRWPVHELAELVGQLLAALSPEAAERAIRVLREAHQLRASRPMGRPSGGKR